MAFDFPPAQDGLRVTNPESGVTYVYRDKYQSWIIEAVDNKQSQIHTVCCTPCSAGQGDLWFNPCTNCLHVYHDGDWLPVVDCSDTSDCVGYKGEVQFPHQLPDKGNELGDLWVVISEAALYVYSSRGWIPADRFDDTELRQLIQEETEARIAVDVELNKLIVRNKEISDRADDALKDALDKETSDRIAGDEALWDKIEECCTNAQEGLEKLESELLEEVTERIEGDKNLQQQIDAIDNGLSDTNDRLDQEIQDRIDGDERLEGLLGDEKDERQAKDEQLLELIREKESKWMGEVPTFAELPETRFDWKPLTDFRCETVYSLTWGPNQFIAGTSGGHVWSSDDGIFWERRHPGITFNGNVLATFYASGVWLIGGENGLVSRSVDGKSWQNYYSTTTSNVQDFAFGNGTYVYVTDGGVVATSPDGVVWTKQDATIRWGVHGVDSILSVTYAEHLSRFVACTQRGMILLSDTGRVWDLVDPGLKGSGKILTITSVEWAGQPMLVAGGDFPERLIYSVDSLNWVTAPRNYFKDGFPTDLKDCGTHLIAALSNGKTAFAFDALVQSWTVEAVGAKERLHAIAWAPTNEHVTYPSGIYVTGGNFGQAFARVPGKGLEPGDTWVVLDEMCLYTWSTLGWVTSCGSGGGGGSAPGIRRLTAGDCIKLNPPSGVGDVVEISLDPACVGGGSGGAGVHVGETPPADPQPIGSLWIREPENRVYFWDGSYWVELGKLSSGTSLGEKPPASAFSGDLWVREPSYSVYVYNGSQWIQTREGSQCTLGQTYPANARIGDRHVREPGMGDYVYNGSVWVQVTGSGGSGDGASGNSIGDAFPPSPQPGHRHMMTPSLTDYVWSGDEWIECGGVSSGGGAGGGGTIGENFPAAPTPGHRHMLLPSLTDYIWTGDEWIECGGASGGGGGGTSIGDTFPPVPAAGDRHIHLPSFVDYVWTGGEWVQLSGASSSGGGLSDSLPTNPSVGQRHISTPSMLDYVWTGDQWVQVL